MLLVRHGQASFGADDYDVLSETGWEQSRLLGAWLAERGVTPDVVLRGGMRRHRETVEGMLAGGAWSAATEVDPGWNEFDHLGVVATYPDLPTVEPGVAMDRREFQRYFELATARWTSGELDAEYPEAYGAFVARVRGALERAGDRPARAGRSWWSARAARSRRPAPRWSTRRRRRCGAGPAVEAVQHGHGQLVGDPGRGRLDRRSGC